MNRNLFYEYSCIILAAIIWGLTGVVVKYSELSVFSVLFLRLIIPVVVIIWFLNIKKLYRLFKLQFLLISMLSFVRLCLHVFAFKYTTSLGMCLILIYMWPLFHYLVVCLFRKELFSYNTFYCIAASFIGVVIIFCTYPLHGDILQLSVYLAAILSAMITGVNMYFIKSYCHQLKPIDIVFVFNFFGALCVAPFYNRFNYIMTSQLFYGFYYGFFIGVISFLLFFKSLQKVQSSNASVLTYVEVPVTIILGVFLFNEGVSVSTLIGGLLILGASLSLVIFSKESRYSSVVTNV